jgi:hypothetical protein
MTPLRTSSALGRGGDGSALLVLGTGCNLCESEVAYSVGSRRGRGGGPGSEGSSVLETEDDVTCSVGSRAVSVAFWMSSPG